MNFAKLLVRILLLALLVHGAAECQKPEISPGGIVNAASSSVVGAPGSMVSIFGKNLAATTQFADSIPLPTKLGGTSVTFGGISAPLFYVSPNQINLQLPLYIAGDAVVSTSSGDSNPMPFPRWRSFGIFTLDGTGCGRSLVLNVAKDGTTSLNSPSNSASPGDYLTIYGTGLASGLNGFSVPPSNGSPTPLGTPLYTDPEWYWNYAQFDAAPSTTTTDLDLGSSYMTVSWAGRTPGLIGVDQVNVRIPATVREGCAVPLRINSRNNGGTSQPVPVSIRQGGGPCIDPPSAGYGLIKWEKVITDGLGLPAASETFTAALTASPGKKPPAPDRFQEGVQVVQLETLIGPSCPVPGYVGLDAGNIAITGTGFGALTATPTVVDGQSIYRAVLPSGAVQPGSVVVTADGGTDVAAFQSSLRIGPGLNITSSFPPGTVLSQFVPVTVNWTSGDPDARVTLTLLGHTPVSEYYSTAQVKASAGKATIDTVGLSPRSLPLVGDDIEIRVEVVPNPANESSFSPAGLSLGGRHTWKYTYRFGGLKIL